VSTPAQRAASVAHAALARASRTEAALERLEFYGRLRRGGYSIQQAAWELRITRRHADRYEARLRRQREEEAA
jgi:hypothetical protein